ncbi:unnamed protein product [Somion occarium]|uniref:Uncharacterized protein n=1 Tax=Somion occarium TaxID=3059160 RepID=A0ABP1D488_9APHY
MTKWLEQQEAVHHFTVYLEWATGYQTPEQGSSDETEVAMAEDGDSEDAEVREPEKISLDVTGPFVDAMAAAEEEDLTAEEMVKDDGGRDYFIAKEAAYTQIELEKVERVFGAVDFAHCLKEFIHDAVSKSAERGLPAIEISSNTQVDLFKQVKVVLLELSQVTKDTIFDSIHAIPGTPADGAQVSVLLQFSTILVCK